MEVLAQVYPLTRYLWSNEQGVVGEQFVHVTRVYVPVEELEAAENLEGCLPVPVGMSP